MSKGMKRGRWTRTPPQGENVVAFLQDPQGVADFIKENNTEVNAGKSARINPQIGVRMVDPELGPLWVVLGEGTWPEAHLKKKGIVWWSKPIDVPMIQILFPKLESENRDVYDSLSQDLGLDSGRRDQAPREPNPGAGGEAELGVDP